MTPEHSPTKRPAISTGLVAALVTAALTACSSLPSRSAPRDPGGVQLGTSTVFQELPPQQANANQCTLVLWSRADETRRILFATDTPATAQIQVDRKTISLARTGQAGQQKHGHAQTQTYTTPDGITLTTSIDFSPLEGETKASAIRSASISYTAPTGESVMVPAVGLATCGPTTQ